MLEIADDASNDWMERTGKDGESIGWQLNGEHVNRSKLRIDTRKWVMERMAPKRFGAQKDEGAGDAATAIAKALSDMAGKLPG